MIGDRIQNLRQKCGLSQAELARQLHVTRSSVNAWESNISSPTASHIIKMCNLFRISSDQLLGLSNEHTLVLRNYSAEELCIIYDLVKYIDNQKSK